MDDKFCCVLRPIAPAELHCDDIRSVSILSKMKAVVFMPAKGIDG
jgi:hypothetical protein